jgi:hypothetical protein
MAMLGIHFMKDVPFRDVYLHAIVRDAEGQKMSKSKGNVADPLVVMEKYGTDAFRFTLAALAQGRDIRISEERIEGYRNFANKLWNASRLVLSNLGGFDPALAKQDAAGARRRLDREPPGRDRRGRSHRDEALPVQRRGLGALPVPVARILRLVPRDLQAVALQRRESRPACADPGDARARARSDPAAPASVHAVHHRGDLAAAAAQGRVDHARAISEDLEEGPQRAGGAADGGGHGPGHRPCATSAARCGSRPRSR